MNLKALLPERKILLLILAFALVNPLHYLLLATNVPEGRVFVGHIDDVLQLTVMKGIDFGFEDPWYFGNILQNPLIGAPFTYSLFGIPATLLGINILFTFIAIKFMLSIVLLVLVYNLIRFFLKADANVGFVLFLFAAGIGSFIYGASAVAFGQPYTPIAGYIFSSEFTELGGGALAMQHLTRIYWILPEIFGLASMLLFFRNKKILSGISLGLCGLFYPLFGLAFALFLALYAAVSSEGRILARIKQSIFRLLPVYLLAVPFAAAWALVYLSNPTGIDLYKSAWFGFNSRPLLSLLVSSVFAIAFASYYYVRKERKMLALVGAMAILLVPFTLVNIYEFVTFGANDLAKEWLSVSGLEAISAPLWQNSLPLEIAFFAAMATLGYLVYKKHRLESFPYLWLLMVFFITAVSARWVPWWPARYGWFLLYPAVIAAVPGIKAFAEKHKMKGLVTPGRLVLVIALLSLPALVGFNYYFSRTAYDSEYVFISEADFAAVEFLKLQPDGRVLAWYPVDQIIPYYTGKDSVIISPLRGERTDDVRAFYSGTLGTEQLMGIIDKYGADYVLLGEHERKLGASGFSLPFLEKVYDSGTIVYRVV